MCNTFCTLFSHHHWHNAKLNNGLFFFMYAQGLRGGFLWLNIKRCGNLLITWPYQDSSNNWCRWAVPPGFFQTIKKPLNLLRDTHTHTHTLNPQATSLSYGFLEINFRVRILCVKLCWDPAKANVKEKIFFEICHLFFDLFRYRLVWIGPLIFFECSLIFFAFA